MQQITTFFRGGDDVKTRGGTFTLTLGGRTSAPLAFDISAFNLEIAINNLAGTRQVSVAPVIVSRVAWSRGYKWTVTFKGLEGDIGLMLVNYDMLVGDEPVMVGSSSGADVDAPSKIVSQSPEGAILTRLTVTPIA